MENQITGVLIKKPEGCHIYLVKTIQKCPLWDVSSAFLERLKGGDN